MKQKPNKSKSAQPPVLTSGLNEAQYAFWLRWLIPAGLLLLTFFVFYPMLQHQFISWDDPDYITQNTRIWKLNSENLIYIFSQPMALNYHPFTMLSLAINYSFSQLQPYSYFLTNLILHLLNVLLVYQFVLLMSNKNLQAALFTAALFAIHPMHVESVAWATERKDVLYLFFYLGALIVWIYYLESHKIIYYFISILLILCSMLSKPAAIILPFVLILIEYYRTGKFAIKSQQNKIPVFLMAAFFMYMTLKAQTTNDITIGDFTKHNAPERFLFASYGFCTYLVKFFIPTGLSILHPYPDSIGVLIYASPLLIMALLAGIYFYKEKRRLLLFGLLFYFINLILVLQFFAIGDSLYSERYSYTPYIGLGFVMGMLLFDAKLKLNKKIIWGGITILCLIFAFSANARVKVWKNSESLWTDMIEKNPESNRGYYGRGNYYSENNQPEKAIADFTKAITIGIDHNGYTNRAVIYLQVHKYEEALKDFNIAIQLKPDQYKAYIGRGRVFLALQRYEEALNDANAALSFRPNYDTYFFRGLVYTAMKKNEEAIRDYTQAANLTSDLSIYNNRGSAYFNQQNYAAAIDDYNRILNQNPLDSSALTNRANAYYKSNQYDKAILDYSLRLNQNPRDAKTLYCRGLAYLQINKLEEAQNDLINSIAIVTNSANSYANLAFVFEKKGDKVNARTNANKAISLGYIFSPEFLLKVEK